MTESTAAFFRVEGTLLKRGTVAAAGYFAANGQGFRERATRLGHVAIAAAGFGLLGQNDRALANRMTWAALRGMSEDRLAVLAEEYVEEQAKPNLLDSGLELISRARRAGHRIILVSESLDRIVRPLAEHARRIDDSRGDKWRVVEQTLFPALAEPIGHERADLGEDRRQAG
jgi:phosphoserine phosphatase